MLNMERSVGFNDYDSWRDWGCILTQKNVTPPEPKTNYIELDGMSGSLDLSEALSGEVTYHDCVFTATFWTCNGTRAGRARMLDSITSALHGRKMRIYDPDRINHYLYGRVKILRRVNNQAYAEFSIQAVCDPWWYSMYEHSPSISVAGTESVEWSIRNWGDKTICPDITVEGNVKFTCNGVTSEATTGQYKVTTFKLFSGSNTIMVSGNGTLTLTYREGSL